MGSRDSIECSVEGLRSRYEYAPVSFNTGSDLSLVLEGETGPKGLSPTSADLLDFAAAVYQIERQLRRQNTSPPERFALRMRLRNPKAWTDEAVAAAQDILFLLGDAVWELDFSSGLRAPVPEHRRDGVHKPKQVIMLSGGMDSTCGAATIKREAAETQPVSFYTLQKGLQQNIASELGYGQLNQWRMNWEGPVGRGYSFFYRSFLFLSLGAAIAESWQIRTILQFENGVLATAIPPSTYWLMTKHAHPLLHSHAGRLFSALFGGEWKISNPFLLRTKRGCVQEAIKALGKQKALQLLEKTETCWYYRSNRVKGGKKKPYVPCGICIPCIIRRTAMPDQKYAYDLLKDGNRNHKQRGENFRSYYLFLDEVLKTKRAPGDFYAILPPSGRELVEAGSLSLGDVHQLFLKFGEEFMSTFNLH